MAINFEKLFEDLHIPMRKGNIRRGWIEINCPFCVGPKDTHFNGGFNQLDPRFFCWRCGNHNYLDAISKLTNTTISQVKSTLQSYNLITNQKAPERIAKGKNLELPGYRLDDREKEYLRNRGFDPDYLQDKFHIRGGGLNGNWAYRILIPIYFNHTLVSWTGRSILSREQLDEYKIPRYKNLSIEQSVVNPKSIFFNIDNCNTTDVILVEGPMDVLRMCDNCICSLGTSVTREQELFLMTRFKKVYIAFDNEPAAQLKAKHLGMNLSSLGLEVEVVNICEDFGKNDPGELTEDEVMTIKKELNLF